MSVNLSTRQFASPTLLADIDRVLVTTGVSPTHLKIEITESAVMENAEDAISLTTAIKSRQIQISIDDFGTGYSSLGYLHQFPADNLKIDRSFVNLIQSENQTHPVVNTITSLAEQLNLAAIAEGIETSQQLENLKQMGCDFGQGYFFSKPLPVAELEKRYLPDSINTVDINTVALFKAEGDAVTCREPALSSVGKIQRYE